MASDNSTYLNPTAHSYISPPNPRSSSPSAIQVFHASLPSFCPTPLIELFQDSSKLPRPKLFVKAETCRLGLPSFKILGGSWATYQSLLHACSLPSAATFQEVCQAAQERQIVLYAATDGNHGRAIARMAKIIGLKARIYVPDITVQSTRDLVASEGSEVIVVNNSEYDEAIKEAADAAKMEPESKGVLVQDHVAYEGYDDVPRWVIEGYTTMLSEIDAALASLSLQPSAIICPVGVGSLAHAVISHYKTYHHPSRPAIIAVESRNAPCLITSLCNGELTTVPTTPTIMAGLCCGTPSSAAWEAMKGGVDLTVTVSEKEAHRAVLEMKRQGVDAGPCGAAGLAAFWKIGGMGFQSIRVGKDGVVVVLCTEGSREYPVPNQGDGRIRLAVSETVV